MTERQRAALQGILYGISTAWSEVGDDPGLWRAGAESVLAGSDPAAQQRAWWVLDHLLPEGEHGVFEREAHSPDPEPTTPLGYRQRRTHWWVRYAWARRQSVSVLAASGLSCEAVAAAWCDVTAGEPAPRVLDWPARVPGKDVRSLVLAEYRRREPDPAARVRTLCGLAREPGVPLLRRWQLIREILRAAASTLPTPEGPLPEDPDARAEWLREALREGGWQEILDLDPRILHGSAAAVAYVHTFKADAWERLNDELDTLERDCPYEAIRRLPSIVPRDRPDGFRRALNTEKRGLYPLVAFCRWLAPEYRDALLSFLTPEWPADVEWRRPCAFTAWVYCAPEPVLAMWRERSLETHLAAILSRRLHAPPALRAGPWIPDVQEVEADVRLYDPFNCRAF